MGTQTVAVSVESPYRQPRAARHANPGQAPADADERKIT
jgi:hypothetical protein